MQVNRSRDATLWLAISVVLLLAGCGPAAKPAVVVSPDPQVVATIRTPDSAPDDNVAHILGLTQPFTIAVLPDTQIYCSGGEPGFAKQIEWLLANARSMNIVFVSHVGDVVNYSPDEGEWTNAIDALGPLLEQDWLPFSIVRGNHDGVAAFLSHLPVSLMEGKPWFVAASPSGLCQAQTFRVEQARFLHIGFQKDPTADELAWAGRLLREPSLKDMPVIVSTHDYLHWFGRSWTGQEIWSAFVRDNPMVFMVLSGHYHTEHAMVSKNAAGLPVFQMVADYQDWDFGGNGLMRLITIDSSADIVDVRTFSPYYQTEQDGGAPLLTTNHFEVDADSRFEYRVDVEERLTPPSPVP
jgi:hypothetical protein